MKNNDEVDDPTGFPHVNEDELPSGLVEDPDFFDISEEQLLVDASSIVSGYAKTGPDEEHANDLIATVFARIDGHLNGTAGKAEKDITLVMSPEAAVKIAQGLLHAVSHFPDEHLGFDIDEVFAEELSALAKYDEEDGLEPPAGWEALW